MAFTIDPSTDIGWVRLMTGSGDQNAANALSDERIQEYLTAFGSKFDASVFILTAKINAATEKLATLQIPDSPDIIKIGNAESRVANLRENLKTLQTMRPATATSTDLPVRRFGLSGHHPSDPRTT